MAHHEFTPLNQAMQEASESLRIKHESRLSYNLLIAYAHEVRIRKNTRQNALKEAEEITHRNKMVSFTIDSKLYGLLQERLVPAIHAFESMERSKDTSLGHAVVNFSQAVQEEDGYKIMMSNLQVNALSIYAGINGIGEAAILDFNESYMKQSGVITDRYAQLLAQKYTKY